MEEVKISYVSHYHHDDFDELNVRINDAPARPVIAQLADDAHNFFLQVDAEQPQVIGATILYADDWFDEIAAAFQRHDLAHPAVRFFLEQQIRAFSAQWQAQQATQATMPATVNPTPVHTLTPPANGESHALAPESVQSDITESKPITTTSAPSP
jgi:hypothetical protein